MYVNNDLKNVPVEHRAKILFDYDTKIKMMDNLNISYYSFNNCLSKFRKVELLSKDNELHKSLSVEPKDGTELIFKFKLDGTESN
jgi:hypothetical protein